LNFNIDFNLVWSQKLLLTPQLKQALEVLEMNSQELFCYIGEQMESNPALEIVLNDKSPYECTDEEIDTALQEEIPSVISLKEHLLLQLDLQKLDKVQGLIGEYLIDNIDENGYLISDIYEVATYFNIPAYKVNGVLEIIQAFDPPGICARSLKECLLIQLRQMDNADKFALRIVEKHLDLLASNDVDTAAYNTGLKAESVKEIFSLIRTLEPRPGREFFVDEVSRPLLADIMVRNIDGKFEALINEEVFPDVNISDLFIHTNVNRAIWLIKCLEQRKDIILKIAEMLIDEQTEFFGKGVKYLKILDPALFAETLDMHETILMKALNEKYLQCRWGTYALESFFDNKQLSF